MLPCVKGNQSCADKLPVSWQNEAWRLLAYRDQAMADERDAIDREDLRAAGSAAHRRLRAELALDKLQAKRKERR